MHITVVTLFPDLYVPFMNTSLVARAQERGTVQLSIDRLYGYSRPKERIDGPTYGHGAGMVIKPEIIERAVDHHEAAQGPAFKIFFSPRGKKLNQRLLSSLYERAQKCSQVLLFPARYEGMDARIEEEYADEIISIGDYVLMGGDLPAMVFLEGFLRLIPDVVGKAESVIHESYSGPFVDYPEYTEPVVWHNREVPPILRSGNHQEMLKWRQEQAVKKTVLEHFEWLRSYPVTAQEASQAARFIPKHYAALMHTQVLLPAPDGGTPREGTTSVTSFDIHDIARSARTYGISHYFVVTPLVDQRTIVQTLLDFWSTGPGVSYNPHRHDAIKQVSCVEGLEVVIQRIVDETGKKPVIIATSAKEYPSKKQITFFDQQRVWELDRPVLFLFGTGRGLAPDLIDRADFVLVPIKGFSPFNHLSVRSAATLVFDRWLGISPKSE